MPRIGEAGEKAKESKAPASPIDALPPSLKPFKFHGLAVSYREDRDECWIDCCFCGKAKMAINAGTGLWSCKVCGGSGNALSFLRKLHELSVLNTSEKDLEQLAASRGLLGTEALRRWGIAKSIISGDWLIPGWSADGKLGQLYRWCRVKGSWMTLATPKVMMDEGEGIRHQMMGPFASEHKTALKDNGKVWICEGPWDGMVLWETLAACREVDDDEGEESGLRLTSNEEASLLSHTLVLAVPGATVIPGGWMQALGGKEVTLLYDNDYPKPIPGTDLTSAPAGWEGMRRAAEAMTITDHPASAVRVLLWGGPDGDQPCDRALPDGTDVRDVLTGKVLLNGRAMVDSDDPLPMRDRLPLLQDLMERIGPMPSTWVDERTTEAKRSGGTDVRPLPCVSWMKLVASCRRAMKWTEGLDRAFSVMLATAASTMAKGDQLWVKVIGPPSCGKSTLCEAMSANRAWVRAVSTMRGFHSGFRGEGGTDEDTSLLGQISGKTLVVKDGDTLLSSPNLSQVLAEARDVYDRVSRAHYRNKVNREYENLSMTWILCGTSSLRQLDSSELGERFLDCVIMEGVDDELEDEILARVARKTIRAVTTLNDAKSAAGGSSPETVEMMRLAAGYLDFLRASAVEASERVRWTDEAQAECIRLAKLTSYMRARPSAKQDETVERELGARLLSQLIRLATYLAVVMNRPSVDEEVLRRVKRTALDTGRGLTMEICRHLHEAGNNGLEPKMFPVLVNTSSEKANMLLRFLARIKAIESIRVQIAPGLKSNPRWRMTQRMSKLWVACMGQAAAVPTSYPSHNANSVDEETGLG